MPVLTKALGDFRGDLKETEEEKIKIELRVDEAQNKRDKAAEENRRTDRAAIEENSKEDLAVALEQDKQRKIEQQQ